MNQTIVLNDIDQARRFVCAARRKGRQVGLVPTMGALHAGHLSLVREAQHTCDDVVTTIFVNPAQFGPHEDFDRYPRTWDADVEALSALAVNMLFAPDVETLYPPGNTTRIQPPHVAHELEGAFRPGHFCGVATIVLKLLQVLPVDCAFFGEKDYQQCLVIRDTLRDLNVPTETRFCATVREADGLAMSSRNRYLSSQERDRALGLYRAIEHVRQRVEVGESDVRRLESEAIEILHSSGVDRVDYAAIRDAETLEEITTVTDDARLLIAAHVGQTRLIDNGRLRQPMS